MAFFGNKRRDFSIQPPRQSTANGILTVTDSANIDFTYSNFNLTANLTQTGVTAGTYGSPLLIPILEIDQWGRVTGVTTTTFSASGILLQTNDADNVSQVILNLTSGTDIQVVDEGGGVIKFNYTGTSGNTYTSSNGITEAAFNFKLGGDLVESTIITNNDAYNLSVTGEYDSGALFYVSNPIVTFFEDPSTCGIRSDTESGVAIFGNSVDNYGIRGYSENGVGIQAEADANYP